MYKEHIDSQLNTLINRYDKAHFRGENGKKKLQNKYLFNVFMKIEINENLKTSIFTCF